MLQSSRWLSLPWLIYEMIIIVGLGLAAVLRVVIPLGSYDVNRPDWLIVALQSAGILAAAGVFLYFWIVVLELFIRIGNEQRFAAAAAIYPQIYQQQQQPQMLVAPPPHQMQQYAMGFYHPQQQQQQQQFSPLSHHHQQQQYLTSA